MRNRHFFFIDILLLPVALYFSYVLRMERFALDQLWPGFLASAAISVIVIPLVFRQTKIYSRYWRYASVEEGLLLAGAVMVGVLLAGGFSLLIARLGPTLFQIPRSIPLIFLFLALTVTAGPRFAMRLFARPTNYKGKAGRGVFQRPQPVLVMGAGDAGAMIVREMRANPHLGLDPVGFLDDDLGKHDVVIHGVRVLGDRHAIPEIVARCGVKLVVIAMPTASGKAIREIVDICDAADVQTKIVPGLYELLDGGVSVSQLRTVQIEDLLRREPIHTDTAAVSELLRGKRVLVTGGGGSIGSELCRQILHCNPDRLIILGHGENSVFDILEELRTTHPGLTEKLVPVIAGTRFSERIRNVFEEHRPQIVFHAAAHKHVPLMEDNPGEAVTNNVLGTRVVLDTSLMSEVERFVMISTDKAVNPTSFMGASKRAAELLVYHAAERSGRPYVAVRFGNVLGSRGSVIHTFRRQIAAGGPVTVTHPEMRRYFMTIPEAVQLVLQAAVLGHGGEVFVLDMGEPVKIVDLARDLIELSGLETGRDIDIEFTGLRPGEKMFEELFIKGESYVRTAHQKIYVASNNPIDTPHGPDLEAAIDRLIAAAMDDDRAALVQAMQVVVPEYRPVLSREQPQDAMAAESRTYSPGAGRPIAPMDRGSGADYGFVAPATNPGSSS